MPVPQVWVLRSLRKFAPETEGNSLHRTVSFCNVMVRLLFFV